MYYEHIINVLCFIAGVLGFAIGFVVVTAVFYSL
jgi:hypothetical protein